LDAKGHNAIFVNLPYCYLIRDVAQPGSARRSGRRGRWFESSHPDIARRSTAKAGIFMNRIFTLLCFFTLPGCKQAASPSQETGPVKNNSATTARMQTKLDSLSTAEKKFLLQLAKENESLIVSDQVERYFIGSDSIPVVNKLVFPSHILIDKGYVYLELEFYGDINDVNISYRYSLGQADTGYGSVSGNDTGDYVHTYKGCGVTACITSVYSNGKKILEKEELR
jgi:hypothetical protein